MELLINIIQKNIKKSTNPIKIIKNYYQPINNEYLIYQSNFIKKELEIRLSHRINDLINLPYGLPLTSEISKLTDSYFLSLEEVNKYHKINDNDDIHNFTNLLLSIRNRHSNAEYLISHAIKKIKYIDLIDNKKLNKHLDKFFLERIGVRTLIGQQVTSVNYNHSIIEKCNIKNIVNDSVSCIKGSTEYIYNSIPNISINIDPKIKILHIPSHIYYIVNEITKNAVVSHFENKIENKPIDISAYETNKDLIIKVSDCGLGFPRKNINKLMSYYYSSNPRDIPYIPEKGVHILSGYGVGLPLSKVYSRYLEGDIIINPVEGYGTDVYIYLDKTENAIENI